MKLKDLELPADILADAIRYRDDLGEDDDEILADALEIGLDREADTEEGPAPLRVRFFNDRARMRYRVELRVDQLHEVEADPD